jgi:type IX secretion system PorP/SprF family membrane protein
MLSNKTFWVWLIVILTGMAGNLHAQQVPCFSQYMFNKFIINPGVAGSEGYSAYSLTSKVQWLGYKEAPITNALSYQTRLVKNRYEIRLFRNRQKWVAPEYGNIGVGFHLYNDNRGLLNQTSFQFTYAYHVKLFLKQQLSFGITSSITQFKVKTDKMIPYHPDGYLNTSRLSAYIPDFNFGIYYTTQYAFLGVSVTQLLQSNSYLGDYAGNKFKLDRNYNIVGGYRAQMSSTVSVEPGFQLKTTESMFFQVDVGARVYYRGQIWGGLSFRTGSAVVTTLGAKYKNLYFGYAYDFSLNRLQNYSYGSHELVISLKYAKYPRKYQWIERF